MDILQAYAENHDKHRYALDTNGFARGKILVEGGSDAENPAGRHYSLVNLPAL